jgi:hypothetical protein
MPIETCTVQILNGVLNTLSGCTSLRQDVWLVGRVPVLKFHTCMLRLSYIFGFVRLRITVSYIRYNRN